MSIYTIEAALKKPLDVSRPQPYFSRYLVLKERLLSTEYAMVMAGFPGGNDHGPEHIKRVLSNLGKLLGSAPLKHLCQYELFLAATGVLYHDVGILRGRADHAATSAKLLEEDQASYIFDENDKAFLPSIVLSHSSSADIESCPTDQHVAGYDVRPRLIAALVRIADELDEDMRRADPNLRAKLELPKESRFYWLFNRRVRGVKIDDVRREIVFNMAFKKEDIDNTSELEVGGSFVELTFKKITKVNRERVYCNRFLPVSLQMQQIRVVLQPVEGTTLNTSSQLILSDETEYTAFREQIPQVLFRQPAVHPVTQALSTSQKRRLRRKRQASRRRGSRRIAPMSELPPSSAVINGYKLFYHRTRKQLSISELSASTSVSPTLIHNLEQVKIRVGAPDCFKVAPRATLGRLEHALGAVGKLEYGQSDDLLAAYIMYYKVNYKATRGANRTLTLDFAPDTKAVVFDFGGTLTKPRSPFSTWERMWMSVGFSIDEAGELHRLYSAAKISHQEWCNRTCSQLRKKGFSRTHMEQLISDIELVDDVAETLAFLYGQGIRLYIVSGSIKEIIVEKLGDAFTLFAEVKANEMVFDGGGLISEIRGHPFDFEGKPKFIRRVVEEHGCSPLEVLFVGNSLNDVYAGESGARTLCVNPADAQFNDTRIWNDYIREMRSLREILPYARRLSTRPVSEAD